MKLNETFSSTCERDQTNLDMSAESHEMQECEQNLRKRVELTNQVSKLFPFIIYIKGIAAFSESLLSKLECLHTDFRSRNL